MLDRGRQVANQEDAGKGLVIDSPIKSIVASRCDKFLPLRLRC